MSDTILIDGVDFESEFRHIRFNGWGDMFTAAGTTGRNFEIPGRHGEVWVRKPRAASTLSLSWSVTPDGTSVDERMARANSEWFKLLRLFPQRRTVQLTRVIGVATEHGIQQVRQVTNVERVDAIAPNWVWHNYQDGFITLRNFQGCWFDDETTTFTVSPGVSTFAPVSGTTDTSAVVITLAGGVAAQVLTNVTTGVSLTYNWAGIDPASTVLIDAEAFTVRRIVAPSTNVTSLSRFEHSGDSRFMVLDPNLGDGVNEFTVSSGTATVQYSGVWL